MTIAQNGQNGNKWFWLYPFKIHNFVSTFQLDIEVSYSVIFSGEMFVNNVYVCYFAKHYHNHYFACDYFIYLFFYFIFVAGEGGVCVEIR